MVDFLQKPATKTEIVNTVNDYFLSDNHFAENFVRERDEDKFIQLV